MSLAKRINRMGPAVGPFAAGINQARGLIPVAGRFAVEQAVMNAVEQMERTPFPELLRILHLAKLPFPTTWIEWRSPVNEGEIGYLCQELPEEGFAFRQFVSLRQARHTPFEVVCTHGRIRVGRNGWRAEDQADVRGIGENELLRFSGDILRLLLLINSPSEVFEIGPAQDVRRADELRARHGRPPLPNLRPIRFNIARFQRAGVIEANRPVTQRQVAEHFVRGHFKTRETGVFWWSPHLRYQIHEEATARPRDYDVQP